MERNRKNLPFPLSFSLCNNCWQTAHCSEHCKERAVFSQNSSLSVGKNGLRQLKGDKVLFWTQEEIKIETRHVEQLSHWVNEYMHQKIIYDSSNSPPLNTLQHLSVLLLVHVDGGLMWNYHTRAGDCFPVVRRWWRMWKLLFSCRFQGRCRTGYD